MIDVYTAKSANGLGKEQAERVLDKLLSEAFLGYDADGWLVKT